MHVSINIYLDEDLLKEALAPVHEKLDRLEQNMTDFVEYEVEEDTMEVIQMGVVTDKVTAALDEVSELRTVTDGVVAWSQAQTAALQGLRDDLATAIENGATDADLAGLDELIATTDAQTGRLAEAITAGTDAEGETPVNPVPPVTPV
jgi:hypothetical protein